MGGFSSEQKLVIKHTFLEYVGEEGPSSCTNRRRALTEPAFAQDLCYGELRELVHGNDSADEDGEALPVDASCRRAESVVVPATPESTPLQCPVAQYVPLFLEHESWGGFLPAAACSGLPPAVSEHSFCWWESMPFDGKNGLLNASRDPVPGEQVAAHYAASEQVRSGIAIAANAAGATGETRTTLMLRGLPETYTRASVLKLLNSEGFFGRFNFLYPPVDFKQRRNLGYVLVNLLLPAEALRLFEHFEGFSNWDSPSENVCSVAWCSPQQGLQVHVERYRNSPVMHESVPEEWRPLLLSHGVPIAFPLPTIKIKAPKIKKHQS